jgi:hypothetical protein
MSIRELGEVRALFEAMVVADEASPDGMGVAVSGDATRLPFPDDAFDRVIASEVMEHIPDDVAVLSDEYYAPKAEGGHVRIYREAELRQKMSRAGLDPGESHQAHALHTPYWWLKCAVGPAKDEFPLVKLYNRFLVWDIEQHPPVTRMTERVLNPVLGKSLVVYATKPVAGAARTHTVREVARAGA